MERVDCTSQLCDKCKKYKVLSEFFEEEPWLVRIPWCKKCYSKYGRQPPVPEQYAVAPGMQLIKEFKANGCAACGFKPQNAMELHKHRIIPLGGQTVEHTETAIRTDLGRSVCLCRACHYGAGGVHHRISNRVPPRQALAQTLEAMKDAGDARYRAEADAALVLLDAVRQAHRNYLKGRRDG